MSADHDTGVQHHPEPEELLAYATGTSPEWQSLLLACHLTLCARCRDELTLLEDLGGAMLEDSPPSAVRARPVTAEGGLPSRPLEAGADGVREERMAFSVDDEIARVVPRPVQAYFAEQPARWRWLGPGIRQVRLAGPIASHVRLLRFRPGFVIPEHGHGGLEWLQILHGDIGDSETGTRFGRGDLCRKDEGRVHSQDVGPDEPCIAVVANLGPLVPRNLLGRVLAKIVGI